MHEDIIRERFEKEMKRCGLNTNRDVRPETGHVYVCPEVRARWSGWQAAYASMREITKAIAYFYEGFQSGGYGTTSDKSYPAEWDDLLAIARKMEKNGELSREIEELLAAPDKAMMEKLEFWCDIQLPEDMSTQKHEQVSDGDDPFRTFERGYDAALEFVRKQFPKHAAPAAPDSGDDALAIFEDCCVREYHAMGTQWQIEHYEIDLRMSGDQYRQFIAALSKKREG